jgi:hypothetical protein
VLLESANPAAGDCGVRQQSHSRRNVTAATNSPNLPTAQGVIGGEPIALPTRALHYGDALTPLALVVPDERWPDMFRIAWPDGRLSDMANLSRAKDAAEAFFERGPPRRDRLSFKWKH